MADSEDEDRSLNLTGFLFGNINEKGELEDTEILDEVTCMIYVVTGMFKVLVYSCFKLQYFVEIRKKLMMVQFI